MIGKLATKWLNLCRTSWWASAEGVLIVFLAGLFFLHSEIHYGEKLVRASYDWLFDLTPRQTGTLKEAPVVIVYLDEASYLELDQPLNAPWDRALHARMADRLKKAGARAVIFDILFTDPGIDPSADAALEEAFRRNGNVILAGEMTSSIQDESSSTAFMQEVIPPWEPLAEASAGWGLAALKPDEDLIIREHYHGPADSPAASLSWTAMSLFGDEDRREHLKGRSAERYIRYYGPAESLPSVSYRQALREDGVAPGFFKDKYVFIGARPIRSSYIETRDEYRSTFMTWRSDFIFMPAVEVHATQLMNLVRGDWLRRLPPAFEVGLILLAAVLFGGGLVFLPPASAFGASMLSAAGVVVGSVALSQKTGVWVPWLIPVLVQIPLALIHSFSVRSVQWLFREGALLKEQRKSEMKIRDQAELLNKAREAIIVIDVDWRIRFWNQGAERILGWEAENALGMDFRKDTPLAMPDNLLEAWRRVMEKGVWSGELELVSRESEERKIILQCHWSLVLDEVGESRSILMINTDATEQKMLETQLLRTQRMESLGSLAGGIAHDLNNVLTPILMTFDFLKKVNNPNAMSLKLINSAESSVKRGAGIIKQILMFARGQSGERSSLEVRHLAREMISIMEETFPKSIDPKLDLEKDLWIVQGDATQLHQVLLNFCVNARDAMPDGGRIVIEAANETLDDASARAIPGGRPGRFVRLSVADTGTGIPKEIREKIFDPFFTTKELGKGTGLGLATTIRIIQNHEGFLRLDSEVGKGTTFSAYLPAADNLNTDQQIQVAQESLMGNGEMILVADDEKSILEVVRATLAAHNYLVITATNGEEAVALFKRHRSKVRGAIIDLNMPGKHGQQVLLEIQAAKPETILIAMSGMLEWDLEREQIRASVLAKPFGPERMLSILRERLDVDSQVTMDVEPSEEPLESVHRPPEGLAAR